MFQEVLADLKSESYGMTSKKVLLSASRRLRHNQTGNVGNYFAHHEDDPDAEEEDNDAWLLYERFL